MEGFIYINIDCDVEHTDSITSHLEKNIPLCRQEDEEDDLWYNDEEGGVSDFILLPKATDEPALEIVKTMSRKLYHGKIDFYHGKLDTENIYWLSIENGEVTKKEEVAQNQFISDFLEEKFSGYFTLHRNESSSK